jgi:hypothetical protein
MPHARGIASIVFALLLVSPVARGQETADPGAINEIRRRLVELLRERQAALAIEPNPAGQDDPFQAQGPGSRPMSPLASRLEAIDTETRVASARAFDVLMFGRVMDEGGVKEHLARQVESRLDRVAWFHDLSREEREKLRLAAGGDMKRYLDRYVEARRGYEDPCVTPSLLAWNQEHAGRIVQLQRGPIGENSLFGKVLTKILADRKATAGRARP